MRTLSNPAVSQGNGKVTHKGMRDEIREIISQLIDEAYDGAKSEYDGLPPEEQSLDAFYDSAFVHASAELSSSSGLGAKIAKEISRMATKRFENGKERDYDIELKDL